jgi:endonuclease YncB( thermonuclease family)
MAPERERAMSRVAPVVAFCLLWSALIGLSQRGTVAARVVGVNDGDTITALVGQKSQKIRIEGIDAPELGQSFGRNAKARLSDLVFGRDVQLELRGTDRYQRLLARVTVDGVDVGRQLVVEGLAWQYEGGPHRKDLAGAEKDARTARRGLGSITTIAVGLPSRPCVPRAPSASAPDLGPYAERQSHVYHAPTSRLRL